MTIALIVGVVLLVWGLLAIDARLVTKPPRHTRDWKPVSKEDEEDLLYTLPRKWVERARERLHHD